MIVIKMDLGRERSDHNDAKYFLCGPTGGCGESPTMYPCMYWHSPPHRGLLSNKKILVVKISDPLIFATASDHLPYYFTSHEISNE
jgi:hypothetical protein